MKIKNDAAFRSTSNTSENRIITRFLARWKGLEPPTFWFVAKHSIQLSYQRTWSFSAHIQPLDCQSIIPHPFQKCNS